MEESDFRTILEGVGQIVESLPGLIDGCDTTADRIALTALHRDFHEIALGMMSRQKEAGDIRGGDYVPELLALLADILPRVKERPPDRAAMNALLEGLDAICRAIMHSPIMARELTGPVRGAHGLEEHGEEGRGAGGYEGTVISSVPEPPEPAMPGEHHAAGHVGDREEAPGGGGSFGLFTRTIGGGGEEHGREREEFREEEPPPARSAKNVMKQTLEKKRRLMAKKGAPPPPAQVVNTGFAPEAAPDRPADKHLPLTPGGQYYFWFDIGEPRDESIEVAPTGLPPLPPKARLIVALFGFKDGLIVTPGADIGEMVVREDGTVAVAAQPGAGSLTPAHPGAGSLTPAHPGAEGFTPAHPRGAAPPHSTLLASRLFFPIRCPAREGTYRMRCNIYSKQVLLQSRIISAQVAAAASALPAGEQALRSVRVLDYSLTGRLDAALLAGLPEHRLSMLINGNGDGTNSIHIYGARGQVYFKRDDVRFDAAKFGKWVERGRGSLRNASWGSLEEWREGTKFLYQDGKHDLDRLAKDLISMAQWGRELYTQFKVRASFENVLLEPAYIQIAMKDSPTQVIPAAMIYDYPLRVGKAEDKKEITLCESFVRALKAGAPLAEHECFTGRCPSREETRTVCPSGFWGFRHYLGTPLSVAEKTHNEEDGEKPPEGEIALDIPVAGQVTMVFAEATEFHLLQAHRQAVAQAGEASPRLVVEEADTGDEVLDLLAKSPHLVYFYCHGVLLRDEPGYLVVGKSDQIYPSYFDGIRWDSPRPLVFMNGCHTVDPLAALDFIEPLVKLSKCAGVIGTEITIYEEMAVAFAEEFFRRFLRKGKAAPGAAQERETVGMAIRNARLALLGEWNPLGLAYIPYVIAGLRLVERPAPGTP